MKMQNEFALRAIRQILSVFEFHLKEEDIDQESIQSSTTLARPRTPHGKVTKTQKSITYKMVKKVAPSQQVTTRLQ